MTLLWGAPTAHGESGGARHATLDGEPVIAKRAPSSALARFEAIAELLDRLRARGVPTPAYRLLPGDDELVVVQTLLPGMTRDDLSATTVADVLAAVALLGDVDGVPAIEGVAWPALLQHSLRVGEDGWCQHEELAAWSPRGRALVEHAHEIGASLDVASVPSSDALHLDLHHHNVLVDDAGHLTGIIDWDGVVPGDRWFDVVYFGFAAEAWVSDPRVLEPLYAAAEHAVTPALLDAYVTHIGVRLADWQLRQHGPADVDLRLDITERLRSRFAA